VHNPYDWQPSKRRAPAVTLLFIFALLLVAGGAVFSDLFSNGEEVPDAPAVETPAVSEPAPQPPAPQPQSQSPPATTPAPIEHIPEPVRPQIEAWPVRMRIPRLSADDPIEGTGYDETDTMEIVASAYIISWLMEGPIPGNDGNAILGGHNRWGGIDGSLLHLDELDIGDDMVIDYADGSSLTFRLESVFVYPLATADAEKIMDLTGEARVTVITCKDPYNPAIGTSDNRIIAVFKEESIFVVPDPPIEPLPLIEPDAA